MSLFRLGIIGAILGCAAVQAATFDLATAEIIADGNALYIINTTDNSVLKRIINATNTGILDTSFVSTTNLTTQRNWTTTFGEDIVAADLSIGNLFVITSDGSGNETLTALSPLTGQVLWQAAL